MLRIRSFILTTVLMIMLIISSAFSMPFPLTEDIKAGQNKATDNRAKTASSQATEDLPLFQNGAAFYFCGVDSIDLTNGSGSDCWGWEAPDGSEYVIMGITEGLAFVDANTMQHLFTVPGQGSCLWRDMATWGQYCYSVSECSGLNGGLMVLDLQYLPDSVHFVTSVPVDGISAQTCHNLSIDSLQGYIYLEGTGTSGFSTHVHDLSDPENPTYVASFGIGGGIHDMYVNNDTAYVAEGSNGTFSIYDMANKAAPALLTRVNVPNPGYVHNIWPTRDGNHIVTTEETAGKTIKVWDISDLNNIGLTSQFLAPAGLAHNAQLTGDTVYLSHYESGILVYDISNPLLPTQLGQVDTYPSENANFNGAWGVFQYTNSGKIYGSNFDGKLYVINTVSTVLADSVWADSAFSAPGTQVKLDIMAGNSHPISALTVPMQWNGPYGLSLDSISTVGLETDYFEIKSIIDHDSVGQKGTISLVASSDNTAPSLPVGNRIIFQAYFSIPGSATGGPNLIRFNPYDDFIPVFSDGLCLDNQPSTPEWGAIFVDNPCCIFNRGNANGDQQDQVNISDITYLVDYLFGIPAGPAPICDKEANANGDFDENTNISDISYLTNYLFGQPSGPAPPACP